MDTGFIKLYRKFQSNKLWLEKREFSKAEAWIDILFEVQHNPKPQQVIIEMTCLTCYRGQSLKSLDTWACRWGWTKSKTRRFFILLKKMGQIDTMSEHVTTRLTVLNYDTYNSLRNANETQVKQKRNASETQATPDNNGKELKNDKKHIYDQIFDRFWSIYPRKVGKAKCQKIWAKLKPSDELFDQIISAVESQKQSAQWTKDGGAYVPNPSTWLNQERWDDEVVEAQNDADREFEKYAQFREKNYGKNHT